jgi:hypothetical protein
MSRNSNTIKRPPSAYDVQITALLKKGPRNWSDAEFGEAITLCIAYSRYRLPEGLDADTSNRVNDLQYAFYRRIRDAIDKAKVTGPIGARAIARLMFDELGEGDDHERLLLKKLLVHLDRSTETAQPQEMRHAA